MLDMIINTWNIHGVKRKIRKLKRQEKEQQIKLHNLRNVRKLQIKIKILRILRWK